MEISIDEVNIYTKKQRLAIYKMALELLYADMENERANIGGFCYYIANAMESYTDKHSMKNWIFFDGYNPVQYPEILAYKPKRKYDEDFWFSTVKSRGGKKRVKIFEEVIAEMEKK